jgi:hypothetical protein
MKTFVFLLFTVLLSLNHKAQSIEYRQFSRSLVVINSGNVLWNQNITIVFINLCIKYVETNITLTTQTDDASFFVLGDQGGLPIYPYKYLI